MINKIKEKVNSLIEGSDIPQTPSKVVLVDTGASQIMESEPDMRILGLFTDVGEEKVAELVQGLLYMDEVNKLQEDSENWKPIEFYLSTYGGSADDMFALYDVMRQIESEIHTIGVGKVMSAGVLLLAAGTKGKRKIGRYRRVMIHSAMAGSQGSLPNLLNEVEALQILQADYINALVAETNMTKEDIKKMLERKVNVYLSAEEAVELGIADIII